MEFSVWNKAIYSSHRFLNIISKGGYLNPPHLVNKVNKMIGFNKLPSSRHAKIEERSL